MEWSIPLIIIGALILITAAWWLPALVNAINDNHLEKEYEEWKETIVDQNKPMPAEIFLNKYIRYDFEGVYLLHNLNKDKYYVGQSINVVERAKHHLTGKGNGDVYADFKYGDSFEVILIDINNTEYSNLNDLERHAIAAFHAYDKGYNKTRGNR